MKNSKVIRIILSLMMVFCFLVGCSKEQQSKTKEVDEKFNASETSSVEHEEVELKDVGPKDDYIDLTKMSSTMVYAEVYNMMYLPENYEGTTVKMKGEFAVYEDTVVDKVYMACLISDALACCQQGIEFEVTGDLKFPEDFPEVGSEIIVEGVFTTYIENEYMYCHLTNAKLQ